MNKEQVDLLGEYIKDIGLFTRSMSIRDIGEGRILCLKKKFVFG